ncbi:DoxX family membrane protein [Halolamina litorea]|uniref:DoxX family membrane protein n=1 Tax=Halolamina litorea TaxID=1515593 RepID=A0ABD6BP43_9EURY|nr:DoxX family membrane protein [Halolamina litorea]
MDPVTATLRRWLAPVVERTDTAAVARLGLGSMLVLAGVHKLLDPGAWALYVTDWLAPWLLVSPTTFMLLNGPPEVLVGVLLLVDRYVAPATAVAAVSLPATVAYLAVVAVIDGAFVDVLIRDVGLTALAWVVLLDTLAD